MKRRIILLMACIAVSNMVLRAQIPAAPVTFQSPNAATLGLYGEVPVSLYTGLPRIEVPLYSFTDNKTSIPIGLSYHASGFRPDMHPGWTGMGWNLSTDYAITRTVNDGPDDYSNSNHFYGDKNGFYFNRQVLNTSNWNQITYMKGIADSASNCFKDTEPDEFSFSYPGGSGKFYFDHTGNWRVKCDKPVKVLFDSTFLSVPITAPDDTRQDIYGNTKSFSGFVVVDENGTQYVYGKTTSAIEYSVGMFTQYLDEWIAQAWYLTKIIQPSGQEVNFTYERDDYINQMYLSVNNNIQTKVSGDNGSTYHLATSCMNSSFYNIYASYEGKLISPVYLKSIDGTTIKVEFARSNTTELKYDSVLYNFKLSEFRGSTAIAPFLPFLNDTDYTNLEGLTALRFKKLDTIRIKYNGLLNKVFLLSYTSDTSKRLTLQSVSERDKIQDLKPPYLFYYDTSVALPRYVANKNDHWGFYNGNAATIDEPSYYLYYYPKRDPNATYLYAGTLNKIIYPTGGATEFQYEPNYYRKRLQEQRYLGIDNSYDSNTLAGGLRIKKITSYNLSTDSKKLVKQYIYDSAGVSSGVLGGRIKYYFDDYRCKTFNGSSEIYSNWYFSSQSVLPGCNNTQGNHIGYSFVREKLSDSSYTDYYFTNFDKGNIDEKADTVLQLTRTAYEPYASIDAERGNLLMTKSYSATNVLLDKKEYAYIKLNKANEYVRALKARFFNVCPNNPISGEEGAAYKIYTYSYLPSLETETTYSMDGSNPIVNTIAYIYDSTYRLLRKETTFNSKGDTLLTSYKYPFDYPSDATYIAMTGKNMVAPVITESKLNNSDTVQVLKTNFYSPFTGRYNPETIQQKIGNNSLETRQQFYAYDTLGNVLEFAKSDDVHHAYLWAYNSLYPVADVINATSSTVAHTSFEAAEKGNWVYSFSIVTDLTAPTGLKVASVPNSGVVYTNTDSTKAFKASIWVNGGKPAFEILKAGSYNTVSSAFSKVRSIGSWDLYEGIISEAVQLRITNSTGSTEYYDEMRLCPKAAQMVTYTYTPFIGMTTQCDANSKITRYVYDDLQRLWLVQDEEGKIIKRIDYKYRGTYQD